MLNRIGALMFTTITLTQRMLCKQTLSLLSLLVLLPGLNSCKEAPETALTEYVILAGPVVVTRAEFMAELDLKLAAYPYEIQKDPDRYNEVVVDLVATLSEESLLLAAAREKQITVTPAELSELEAGVRADFPEDSFEQVLLENAIPYLLWKKKLEKSLIIEKLVQAELMSTLEITAEDMKAFFRQARDNAGAESIRDEHALVERLHLEKGERQYQEWVKSLKQAIAVDINRGLVSALLIDSGSPGKTPGQNAQKKEGSNHD